MTSEERERAREWLGQFSPAQFDQLRAPKLMARALACIAMLESERAHYKAESERAWSEAAHWQMMALRGRER